MLMTRWVTYALFSSRFSTHIFTSSNINSMTPYCSDVFEDVVAGYYFHISLELFELSQHVSDVY